MSRLLTVKGKQCQKTAVIQEILLVLIGTNTDKALPIIYILIVSRYH